MANYSDASNSFQDTRKGLTYLMCFDIVERVLSTLAKSETVDKASRTTIVARAVCDAALKAQRLEANKGA